MVATRGDTGARAQEQAGASEIAVDWKACVLVPSLGLRVCVLAIHTQYRVISEQSDNYESEHTLVAQFEHMFAKRTC